MQNVFGRLARRKAAPEQAGPLTTPLGMLERLQAGEHPDYCLYLRPPACGRTEGGGLLSVDLEDVLARAFAPLPVVMLDETGDAAALPDEAFCTLADRARVLCAAPTDHARFVERLLLLKTEGPLARTIFAMPDAGTLGTTDWPAAWPAAVDAAGRLGVELSGYTAGGWLFRIGPDGKACTFRPIVNPNPEKVAKALEAICGEMG